MGGNGKENDYTQPLLTGMEAEKPQETELENCLVLSRPEYQDRGKRREWVGVVHAQPSIFHPETDMHIIASAKHELAIQSQRKSLKPGDRVMLTGVMREETVTFPTGETKTIYYLALTQAPQMVAKEKRVSTTVYEQQKQK